MEQHANRLTTAGTSSHHKDTDVKDTDVATRARDIRCRLPGQLLRERLETVHLLYGQVYRGEEIEQKVAVTLRSRVGYRRTAVLEPIETYRSFIPDDALVKYDDAVRTGLFSSFLVVTPAYRAEAQPDPWIVGEVRDAHVFAVIAQWA